MWEIFNRKNVEARCGNRSLILACGRQRQADPVLRVGGMDGSVGKALVFQCKNPSLIPRSYIKTLAMV